MRFLNMLFGGLLGATPGLILVAVSGELIGLTLIGLLLILVGFIVGARIFWKKSDWLNAYGIFGGLIGLVPGIIMIQFDPDTRIVLNDPLVILRWNEVVTIALAVGFPLGVFIGNRIGRWRSGIRTL